MSGRMRRAWAGSVLGGAIAAVAAMAAAAASGDRYPAMSTAAPDLDAAARGSSQAPLAEAYRLADTWDGDAVGAPGSVLHPAGIDADDAEVVLVDAGNRRIEVFSPEGAFVRAFARGGDGPGELAEPRDVVIDGQRLLVADRGNGRILVFDRSGAFVEAWAVDGLARPWGLAASSGRVYASQPETGEVFVLEGGRRVAVWTGLEAPRGLDVGPDGRVHVAEEAGMAVTTRAADDGRVVDRLVVGSAPMDVSVDHIGDRYVMGDGSIHWYPKGASRSERALYRRAFRGVVATVRGVYATEANDEAPIFHGVLRYPWQPRENAEPAIWALLDYPLGRLEAPAAIAASEGERIWVADAWPRAQAFSPDGRAERQVELCAPGRSECGATVDLALLADGSLLAGERSRLKRVRPDGTMTDTLQLRVRGDLAWITGLAVHPDGTRARTADGSTGAARDYGLTLTLRPAGSFPLTPPLPGSLWHLYWDIAIAPPESPGGPTRTYAVNRTARRVEAYELGLRVDELAVDGIPMRVALDQAGDLFVLTTDGLVWKLAPDGTVLAGWDAGAFAAAGSEVVDLTVDAGGRVYTLDRIERSVRVWEPDPDGSAERPVSRAGACRVRGDKRAVPGTVKRGERITVTLQIGGDCPNTAPRADIVLAVDRSGSMLDNGGITATRQAAIAFLDAIDLGEDRVAVVAFNHTAQLLQPLTDDVSAARTAIEALSAIGGTDLEAPLRIAEGELFGPRGRSDAKPIVVLLTDGRSGNGPEAPLAAAARAKQRGARIFTIGFGDIDPMVMALTASTPEDAYLAADPSTLGAIYAEIASRLTAAVLVRTATVTDELPLDMAFAGMVSGPAPRRTGRMLTWDLADVPFGGAILSYAVTPSELGRRPTNVRAEATFVDGLRRDGRLLFPVPRVDVVDVDPTVTPTPTPFPTPTPTSRPPVPVFLPIALRQSCQDVDVATEVVIVMDNSNSMSEPTEPGGPTQLEAAVSAAGAVIDRLRPIDRAAIVAFHDEAEIIQALTSDVALLRAGLGSIEPRSGTRVDRGLDAARGILEADGQCASHTCAIVLLTDGRSSVDDATVMAAADAAKALVVDRLFVIGLGSEEAVDRALLERLASAPEAFFVAPTAGELAAIYAAIARTLVCANLDWP